MAKAFKLGDVLIATLQTPNFSVGHVGAIVEVIRGLHGAPIYRLSSNGHVYAMTYNEARKYFKKYEHKTHKPHKPAPSIPERLARFRQGPSQSLTASPLT